MSFPSNYRYTKDHEWAHLENQGGKKVVTIGLTDHAAKALGDIVFVELPKVGRELKAHDTIGVVESIKAVSDVYSPVSGKVVAINENLPNDPAEINRNPHDGAWLCKIELSDESSYNALMDATAYNKYAAESH